MSIGSSETPESLSDLNYIKDAYEVYEELGSTKNLIQLVDRPPKLLLKEDVELRLHDRFGKRKDCRIYVFDSILLIGSARKPRKSKSKKPSSHSDDSSGNSPSTTSSDKDIVWFGEENSKSTPSDETDSNSAGSSDSGKIDKHAEVKPEEDSDSDTVTDVDENDSQVKKMIELDQISEEEKKRKKMFNLRMYVDLLKAKPKFMEKDGEFEIMLTFVTKRQEEISPGEFRYETTVDLAEIWMDDAQKGKVILGLIQEAVDQLNEKELLKQKKELLFGSDVSKKSMKDSDSRTSSMTSDDLGRDTGDDKNTPVNNNKKTDSESNRDARTSSSTSSSTGSKKKRKNLQKAKETMAATTKYTESSQKVKSKASDHKDVLTISDIKQRYEAYNKKKGDVATYDEGKDAEFTVVFKNPSMGFAMSSSGNIGPFIVRLVPGGMAEQCGMVLGDRVIGINDQEIPLTMGWQDCVKLIKAQGVPLRLRLFRKQKNEIERQKQLEAKQIAEEEKELERLEKEAQKNQGKVTPEMIEDESFDDKETASESSKSERDSGNNNSFIFADDKGTKFDGMKTIQLQRKSQPDANGNAQFTIKRKTRREKIAMKKKELKKMLYTVTNVDEAMEFRKNKKYYLDGFYTIENLFDTMLNGDYLKSPREKTCVHALKEIYKTESDYSTHLAWLREFHVKLTEKKRHVLCKELRPKDLKGAFGSSPFCEHRRPIMTCSQKSKLTVRAFDKKELDAIFLNIKPMMKANLFLFRTLQKKLVGLFEQMEKNTRVEVVDLLNTYCQSFIEIAPFLQMYWTYCQRYAKAAEAVKHLRMENKYFNEVCNPIEKEHKMSLTGLLVKPVQRITKYPLLFSTLTKYVQDYIKHELQTEVRNNQGSVSQAKMDLFDKMVEDLTQACGKIQEIVMKVNMRVGEADNLDLIMQIYSELRTPPDNTSWNLLKSKKGQEKLKNMKHSGLNDLIQPHRRFDSKIPLIEFEHLSKPDKSFEHGFLYLFNDVFIIAEEKSKRNPSLFGGRAMAKFSLGKSRGKNSSGKDETSVRTSLTPATLGKMMSMRSNEATLGQSTRKTPKSSKSDRSGKGSSKSGGSVSMESFYEVVIYMKLKCLNLSKVTEHIKKGDDNEERFGLEYYYSVNDELSRFRLYFLTAEERNKVKESIAKICKAMEEKADKLSTAQQQYGQLKKRKFKKKLEGIKKQSVEKRTQDFKDKIADNGKKMKA